MLDIPMKGCNGFKIAKYTNGTTLVLKQMIWLITKEQTQPDPFIKFCMFHVKSR